MLKRLAKNKNDSKDEVFNQIVDIIKKISNRELDHLELEPQMKLRDLGFDSIKFMTLLLNLEDVVGKDIEEIIDEISNLALINTIQDMVNVVNDLRE